MSDEQRANNLGIYISPSDPRYQRMLEEKLEELTKEREIIEDKPPAEKEKLAHAGQEQEPQ